MSKFTVVTEAPKTLEKGELVIDQPDFMEQVQSQARKAPKHKQTAINHMREILNAIGQKYDHDMNVFKIKLVNYEGVAYSTDEDLSKIIVKVLRHEYPIIFSKVLEYQLKNRPLNTKLIYYVGEFSSTGPFYGAGLDYLEEKDVEGYLTGKPKKVVGKPALSKEQLDEQKSSN